MSWTVCWSGVNSRLSFFVLAELISESFPLSTLLRGSCDVATKSASSPTTQTTTMTIQILSQPPASDGFTPLDEHQSRTPGSFFDGKPVLHYHSKGCSLVLFDEPTDSSFPLLRAGTAHANGDASEAANATRLIPDIDVWVGSE
jgi:hypothetical protein